MGDCLLGAVFFENVRSSPHFCSTFFLSTDYVHINFDKNWVWQHFGRFFTNSSGHPDVGALFLSFS
jgi:hypothetical protein